MTDHQAPEAMTDEQAVDEIMSQAQVFASAWSLVGGRFDSGNALEDAEEAKQELRSMLAMWTERLRAQPAGHGIRQVGDTNVVESVTSADTQPAGQAGGDPVGSLTVSLFRGHLENHDFDYFGKLPPGTYQLFACSTQPSGEDQVKNAQPDFMSQLYQSSIEMAAPQQQAGGEVVAEPGTVYVDVSGLTGTGKSAVAGEIEIAMRAIGLQVEWADGQAEKNMTGADWAHALEMYKPRVIIREKNITSAAFAATPAPEPKAEPVKPLFAAAVAARKWAELQAGGHRMQSISFDGGKGGPGTIDPWGVVRWGDTQAEPVRVPEDLIRRLNASIAWLERGESLPGSSACISLNDIKAIRQMVVAQDKFVPMPIEPSLDLLNIGWGICGGDGHASAQPNRQKINAALANYRALLTAAQAKGGAA